MITGLVLGLNTLCFRILQDTGEDVGSLHQVKTTGCHYMRQINSFTKNGRRINSTTSSFLLLNLNWAEPKAFYATTDPSGRRPYYYPERVEAAAAAAAQYHRRLGGRSGNSTRT
jgi:hypothetical protein